VDHKSPYYNEKNKQGIFYAQAWALMHYLIIGKVGKLEQLGKFMELLSAKAPMEQAFQQAFETPFAVMEKDLREYVKKDRYNILNGHFEKKLELDTTTQATTLTEAEAQAYLGDLLLHSNRKEAYTYLEKALSLDPNLAMAHASLGMAYFREGKVKEAHASLERAVASNSQNYLAHYYYAFTLSRATPDDASAIVGFMPETVKKIREHLQKAIALRPDFPESYNLLAFISLVTSQGIDDAITSLKRALAASPGRHDMMHMLAQLYLRKDDYKTARALLEQVVKSAANEEVRQRSENLLKQLHNFEEQKARFEAMKNSAEASGNRFETVGSVESSSTTPEPPPDPSAYLREVLRSPHTGETQLQAKLVKIECDSKGLVFVMQTANGLLRLRTANFEEVEITTYDPSVKGEISCGPRTPENTVVISYVPNTDKREKGDGVLKSVEFVPADFKLKSAPK
jgi:FimV-like protein